MLRGPLMVNLTAFRIPSGKATVVSLEARARSDVTDFPGL